MKILNFTDDEQKILPFPQLIKKFEKKLKEDKLNVK